MNRPSNSGPVDHDQVLVRLRNWFKGRGAALEKFQQNDTINYLELGLIDSMGLMELIAELEQTYQVCFDQTHFQDPRFMTLQGLAELTADLCARR